VIGSRRSRVLLLAAAVLALVLVAGRWLAVETAERAWAATLPAGGVYLEARALARLTRLAVWVVATIWGTGHLYIVYRAIGSVQMPRRVGNLEIVEAVPQRLLLILAIGSGLVFGLGLAWGTGDWWREALLATADPRFGLVDPILHRDLGDYVGRLPWALERQGFLMLATVTSAVLVAFLYVGIGSLRWQQGRLVASPHARVHVGVLLAGVALAMLWGALLDPAEVVAGLHGPVAGGAVTLRIPGAIAVAIAAGLASMASIAWALWDRVRWFGAGWALLLAALVVVYGVFPALGRATPDSLARTRADFTTLAFGTGHRVLAVVPEYPSMRAFVSATPLWTAPRVAAAARPSLGAQETVAGTVMVRQGEGAPGWLVARAPDDSALATLQPEPPWETVHRGGRARTGAPRQFAEADSGLVPVPLAVRDSTLWFGEGFTQYAVTTADGPGPSGIALGRGWKRFALAWVLQSPELVRRTRPDDRLLWRRSASERFARLAPFAEFARPEPVMVDGALWWRAVGYVSSPTFPLVAGVRTDNGPARYRRAGVLGAVRAASGETRFWLLPGADSLTVAWARLFAPLVSPADSVPPALLETLRFPDATFSLAVRSMLVAAPDSDAWRTLSREPYELSSPGSGAPWLAQGFTSGQRRRLEGFLLGSFGAAGPELWYARSPTLDEPPQLLVGAGDTTPELARLWIAGGHLASTQARFIVRTAVPPRLERVFLTWGNREGQGRTRSAALADLAAAGSPGAADTSLAARWEQASRLFAQLDSALQARDFDWFGRVYRQLSDLLGRRRRALAPPSPSR
jgi:hypothetical protein